MDGDDLIVDNMVGFQYCLLWFDGVSIIVCLTPDDFFRENLKSVQNTLAKKELDDDDIHSQGQ